MAVVIAWNHTTGEAYRELTHAEQESVRNVIAALGLAHMTCPNPGKKILPHR
jgi:hypothetical protein